MPDRTFQQAVGYEKSAPVFNFIKDQINGQWRPMTSDDVAGGGGGGGIQATITGVINQNILNVIGVSGIDSIKQGIEQTQKKIEILQLQNGYKTLSEFVRCNPNLQFQYNSYNFTNGEVTSQGIDALLSSYSFRNSAQSGISCFQLPQRIYANIDTNKTGYYNFNKHQINIYSSGVNFSNGDYFLVYQAPDNFGPTSFSDCVLTYSGELSSKPSAVYFDEFSCEGLIVKISSQVPYNMSYKGIRY